MVLAFTAIRMVTSTKVIFVRDFSMGTVYTNGRTEMCMRVPSFMVFLFHFCNYADFHRHLPYPTYPYNEIGFMHGEGDEVAQMRYATGSYYEGEYKNGEKNGFGEFYHGNGDVYRGEFENGIMHGEGVYE